MRCLQKNCRDLYFHSLPGLAGRTSEYLVKSFLICSRDNRAKLCEQLCSVHTRCQGCQIHGDLKPHTEHGHRELSSVFLLIHSHLESVEWERTLPAKRVRYELS